MEKIIGKIRKVRLLNLDIPSRTIGKTIEKYRRKNIAQIAKKLVTLAQKRARLATLEKSTKKLLISHRVANNDIRKNEVLERFFLLRTKTKKPKKKFRPIIKNVIVV